MNNPSEISPREKLASLLALFPDGPFREDDFELIEPQDMPAVYRNLLEHHHHMTVTLETRHGGALLLHVLESRQRDDEYSRLLRLSVGASEANVANDANLTSAVASGRDPEARARRIVLAGIMNIRLRHCGDSVRSHITRGDRPLGRILIENEVLRWIETEAYLRVSLRSAALRDLFGASESQPVTFGRIATIHCNNEPAVELLEIVAPENRKDSEGT